MKRIISLLAGVSLLASNAMAGSVSGVAGTLDATLVDPAPAFYPHFICSSGCGAGGAVSEAGAWSVSISNLPSVQSVTGSMTVPGVATAANQPALNGDGGGLAHVTNFPAIQSVTGGVSVTNFPASQTVSGSVMVSNLPGTQPISAADGSDATLGGKLDAQCVSVTNACSVVAVLKALLSANSSPIPTQSSIVSIGGVGLLAGVAKIGQAAIDQTTPGVSNATQQLAIPPTASATTEACHVLKGAPGSLFAVSGVAPSAETIMIFNAIAAPADGTVGPVFWYQVSAAGSWGVSFVAPESLSVGITVCASSTGGFTKTALAGNVFSGQSQ